MDVEDNDSKDDREHLLDVASNGHGQRARLLVGREADDVQTKGKHAVEDQAHQESGGHADLGEFAHAFELAGAVSIKDALHKGKRRHAHQQVERVELELADQDRVSRDRLDRGKQRAKNGEQEADQSKVILAKGGETNTDDDLLFGKKKRQVNKIRSHLGAFCAAIIVVVVCIGYLPEAGTNR